MSEVALNLRKIFHGGSYPTGLLFAHHPAENARLKALGAGKSAMHNCGYLAYKALKYTLIISPFAHLPGAGTHIRYVQQLPGHKDIRDTLTYSHLGQPMVDRANLKLRQKFSKRWKFFHLLTS